jgi:hypothetical protein
MPSGEFEGTARFKILRRLGAGGMGVVYEAQDGEKNVRVALKTMQSAQAGALLRFKTEFRALADLAHPNLAALHELHMEGPVPFFTMEVVRGVDLLTYVRGEQSRQDVDSFASTEAASPRSLRPSTRPNPSPERSALRPHTLDEGKLRQSLRQLAAGVQALHDAGKLHRDLKPSNVLVTPEGRVVILDFGLVADIDPGGLHATVGDVITGTPEYMAPEQAACATLTEASDWYAVGAMLYEALAGRLPYSGPSLKVLLAKQTDDPPAPSSLAQGVPEDLDHLAMELLRRDPVARPKGRRVLHRLGAVPAAMSGPTTTPHSGTMMAPFLGRQAQLGVLTDAFARVAEGHPVTVHVRGPSGMGKTSLVRRGIDQVVCASSTAPILLSGRCYEQESVPYKAVDSVIDSLSRYLRSLKKEDVARVLPTNVSALERLFPVLRRVEGIATAPRRGGDVSDPHEMRRRGFAALRDMVTRIALRSPLIVWIDDLQWGDVDSGMLLGELLRPPDPPPILLVVSYRNEADVDVGCLAALRRVAEGAGGAETRTIDVGALAHDEAKQLAGTLLAAEGAPDDATVESVARESAGNPFLIAELARFHQSGLGVGRTSSGSIRLEDVLVARLAQSSEGARLLLEIVAVAGRPIALDVAFAAAELEPATARAAAAQLRAMQLVRTARARDLDALDTFHDRIRETVPRILGADELVNRHARLVSAIAASRDPDPEALATHCVGAGDMARAGDYAEEAAEQAFSTLAFDRSAEWFSRSIEWRALEPRADRELRRRLADALANAGRGAEAGRAYLRAAEGLAATEGAELHQRAAAEFLTNGYMDEGIAVVRALLRSIGATYPASQRLAVFLFVVTVLFVRLRGYRFRATSVSSISPDRLHRLDTFASLGKGLAMTDNLRGRYFLNRFLLGALAAGEPSRVATALVLEIAHQSASGVPAAKRVYWLERRLDELPRELLTPELLALRSFASGWARVFLARWSEALVLLDDASERFRELPGRNNWERNTTNIWIVSSLWHLGRVRELALRIAAFREDAARRGDVYISAFMNIGTGGSGVWLAADEPERALDAATTVFERWPQVANDIQRFYALTACVHANLYMGDGAAAFARCAAAWTQMRRAFLLRVQPIRITVLHLRGRAAVSTLARGAGDPTARQVAEDCVRRLARERSTYAPAMSLALSASLAEHDGRDGEAARLYGEAAQGFDQFSMALYAAACRRRLGECAGGDAGRQLVVDSYKVFTEATVKDPVRMIEMFVPRGRLNQSNGRST